MSRRLAIFLFCCALTVAATTVSFSQDANKPASTPATDTKPTSDAVQPGTDANRNAAPQQQPEQKLSNADKAKSFFDGATTFVNSKAAFRLSSRDNLLTDKIIYKIDGGADQTFDKEFSITAEGKHVITYHAEDKVGNREEDKSFSVIVDNTAPEVVVNPKYALFAANGKFYVSKLYSFNVSATDALSGVNRVSYSVNGKDFADYATAFSIYADGDVKFSVKAEDNVGNKSAKFKFKSRDDAGKETVEEKDSLQLYVDNIPPAVTITTDKQLIPVNGKNCASKEFKYTVAATDKESGVKMILARSDGKGDFIPYDQAISFNSNGDHYIEAKAIDAVGNVSDTVILTVYVDIIPPRSSVETITDSAAETKPAETVKPAVTTPTETTKPADATQPK
jgi:hypothetical protein